MNTDVSFFKELSHSFFRLLALIGFAVGATIFVCLLIGCTVKVYYPAKSVWAIDTVKVYLPEEHLRYDSRKTLKMFYDRMIQGDSLAYPAYIQNRYWIVDKVLNYHPGGPDFKVRKVVSITGTTDTLIVRYAWPNGDTGTVRLIPENDSWSEENLAKKQ